MHEHVPKREQPLDVFGLASRHDNWIEAMSPHDLSVLYAPKKLAWRGKIRIGAFNTGFLVRVIHPFNHIPSLFLSQSIYPVYASEHIHHRALESTMAR